MTTTKKFILGATIIVTLWGISWILLVFFISNPTERGVFGDMFGAVNSLFSGMALCGVVYSILLQQESNQISNYQFRFNHIFDVVNKQTEIFNTRIAEFNFKALNGNNLSFTDGINFFKSCNENSEASMAFIERNEETINSILPFIYHSNKFINDLIDGENISESDKEKLKSLYFRNQHRAIVDYYSLNTEILKKEKEKYESFSPDLKEIHNAIFNIKISMIKSILENDYS